MAGVVRSTWRALGSRNPKTNHFKGITLEVQSDLHQLFGLRSYSCIQHNHCQAKKIARTANMLIPKNTRAYSSVPSKGNFIARLYKTYSFDVSLCFYEFFTSNKELLARYWSELDSSTRTAIIQTGLNWGFFLGSGGILYAYGFFKGKYDDVIDFFATAAAERAKAEKGIKQYMTEECAKLHQSLGHSISIGIQSHGDRMKMIESDMLLYKAMTSLLLMKVYPAKVDWGKLGDLAHLPVLTLKTEGTLGNQTGALTISGEKKDTQDTKGQN